MATIYGIDTSKEITPVTARKAVEECFFQAHCEDTGLSGTEGQSQSRQYCNQIITKAFESVGGDYNNPTKDTLFGVVNYLVSFSSAFRDEKIIDKHKNQISKIINAIK